MRGRDKLLEEIDGAPLLLRQVRAALSLDAPVLVTLPSDPAARGALLADVVHPLLDTESVPDAADGLSASLRTGAQWAAAKDLSGVMVVLPDMPDLTAQDLQTVAALHRAHPGDVIRATDVEGRHGHPTLLPARLFPALLSLTGDRGARDVLQDERIMPCALPGTRATTDLDTPEAWAAWRDQRS